MPGTVAIWYRMYDYISCLCLHNTELQDQQVWRYFFQVCRTNSGEIFLVQRAIINWICPNINGALFRTPTTYLIFVIFFDRHILRPQKKSSKKIKFLHLFSKYKPIFRKPCGEQKKTLFCETVGKFLPWNVTHENYIMKIKWVNTNWPKHSWGDVTWDRELICFKRKNSDRFIDPAVWPFDDFNA